MHSTSTHQEEVYFADYHVLQVVTGAVIFKLYVQAILDANLHLRRGI